MRRRISVVAIVLLATVAAVAPTEAAAPPPDAGGPSKLTADQARKQATGCQRLYTRAQQRSYVTRVYRSSKKTERRWVATASKLTRCQHSERSESIARRKWKKERRARAAIFRRWSHLAIAPRAKKNPGIGYLMMRERGELRSWPCVAALYYRESKWNHQVYNTGGSGAYGIPQALPGAKMASAGPRWKSDPRTQIRWGLGYNVGKFGGHCAADAHQRANNSY